MPRASTAWRGNEAGWITASGWAAAGQQLWGEALVATTDGVFSPDEAMSFPRGNSPRSTKGSVPGSLRKWIPELIITAYKDWQLKRSKPKIWPVETGEWLENKRVMMVWQRHDLFPGPGRRLADRHQAPLVISVEALAVWEARKWGVRRPLWGWWLERFVEARSLKGADLVCCVTEEVRQKVLQLGVSASKVMVTPNRVDARIFHPRIDGREVAEQYRLQGRRVIGWTGSFRAFHGLDSVVHAFKILQGEFDDIVLMLVGDGQHFEETRRLVRVLGLEHAVIFTGRQPFFSIPNFVANFYIGIVSAASAEGFHYSPLKLKEYLAVGCAVIAPRAGDLAQLFEDRKNLLLYKPGDAADLAGKIRQVLEKESLRDDLVKNAKIYSAKNGTWTDELEFICKKLAVGN